jgi:hypothetical protein
MIISRIKGGLGNQLFAYAASRRLSIINSDELLLDSYSGFKRDYKFQRKFQLKYFNIPCKTINTKTIYLRKLQKLISKFLPYNKKFYIEQEFDDFDERLLSLKTNKRTITVDGLWQSELYFADIEEIIRNDLIFTLTNNKLIQDTIELIEKTESVSIHVRMFGSKGDKRNVSSEYYEKAISYFQKSLSNPIFYLFTDNIDYAEDLLSKANINFHNISDKKYHEINDVAELLLMSKCEHHIIANSTFSWWGAWLAKSRNQKVSYPLPGIGNNWCWNYTGQMPKNWNPIRNCED